MQIVSITDNVHETSNSVSLEKREKYFKMLSAENYAKSTVQGYNCSESGHFHCLLWSNVNFCSELWWQKKNKRHCILPTDDWLIW